MVSLVAAAAKAGHPIVERAAVMGCGGVLGIAWAMGVVAGLARSGVHVREADALVGASAGAVVAAQLASDVAVETLLAEQLSPSADSREQLRPYSQAEVDGKNQTLFAKVQGNLELARQRIGAYALRGPIAAVDTRRQIVQERLPTVDWPARSLRVVAVNARTGQSRVFDRASQVDFVDAIVASCAVPGVWPTVEINGELYMDGGVRSMTNADLAAGARLVLVISPQGYSPGNPVSGHLQAEVAMLRGQGSAVQVIEPDADSLSVMGPNILDPSRRSLVAHAGLTQALSIAYGIADFWNKRSA